MNKVSVYQQRPEPGIHVESSLHHIELHKPAGRTAAKAGIILCERELLSRLVLRGDAANPVLAAVVHQTLGLELPVALTLVAGDGTLLQWLASDEWLLIVPGDEEYAVEQRLCQVLGKEPHYAVVNVNDRQTLFGLSGTNVHELLMKSTSYNVHPSSFPVGKTIGNILARSQYVTRRTGEDTWELVVCRNLAGCLRLWLQGTNTEYGLQVAT